MILTTAMISQGSVQYIQRLIDFWPIVWLGAKVQRPAYKYILRLPVLSKALKQKYLPVNCSLWPNVGLVILKDLIEIFFQPNFVS